MSDVTDDPVPPSEEEVKAAIAKRIKSAREDRGMSRAELSRRTGVSNSAIMRWEQEINLPPIHQIMKVAEKLDYSLAWFLQDLDAEIRTGTNLSGKIFPTEETDRAEKAVRLKDLVQAAPSVQILVSVADEPQRRQANLRFGASENPA